MIQRIAISCLALFGCLSAALAEPVKVHLQDGVTAELKLLRIQAGILTAAGPSGEVQIPLTRVRSIEFGATEKESATEQATHRGPIRIALMEIELDSRNEAKKRLDRIGADYELVSPAASLETLRKYQIVYFPHGWATLSGLGDLHLKFHQYVQEGGALLFAEPNASGDAKKLAALKLLPHAVTLSSGGAIGGESVVSYSAGKNHPLIQGVVKSDLPYPHDYFYEPAADWTIIAQSNGSQPAATLLAARVGQGRVVLHANPDDYGHQLYFMDRYVVRVIKWLARRPDQEVIQEATSLGARRLPEFVQRLNEDYNRLIAAEPAEIQQVVAAAERLLRTEAQQSSTWTSYKEAIAQLRRRRSKAAIPMLLRLLADDRLIHSNYQREALLTMTILTGRDVPDLDARQVAEKWWFPQAKEIVVDPAKMTRPEQERVIAKLLEIAAWGNHYLDQSDDDGQLSAYTLYHLIYYNQDRHYWTVEDFPKSLDDRLIDAAETPALRFAAMTVMVELRKQGRLAALPKIVASEQVEPATRLMAAIALWKSEKRIDHESLIGLLPRLQEPELLKAAVITLGHSSDAGAVEAVIGYLNDKRPEIMESAVWACYTQKSPQAVGPLGDLLRKDCRYEAPATRWMVRALGSIESNESAATLAGLIQLTVDQRPTDQILPALVDALEEATDQSFPGPKVGKPTPVDRARQALAWWKDH